MIMFRQSVQQSYRCLTGLFHVRLQNSGSHEASSGILEVVSLRKNVAYYSAAALRKARRSARSVIYGLMQWRKMTSIASFEACKEQDIVFKQSDQEVIVLEPPFSNADLPDGIVSKVGVHSIDGSWLVVKQNVLLLG